MAKHSQKIALIIPYFGKYPEWIDLYFYSCQQNKTIDFYFFTDSKIPEKHADNLYFQQISFTDYCKTASEKLGIDFSPKSAYKLCDLKVFYGFLHQDLLKNYDFWGFGDVDVIWGNIAKFYTPEMLEKYDVFSTHADRVSGHLAILRNNKKYRELCFKIKDWKTKLAAQNNFVLDEQDFSRLVFPESWLISKFYTKILMKVVKKAEPWVVYFTLTPYINKFLLLKQRRLFFRELHTTPYLNGRYKGDEDDSDEWLYKNGAVVNLRNLKEYIYLHFMVFKKNSFKERYFWKENFYKIGIQYNTIQYNTIQYNTIPFQSTKKDFLLSIMI
jgi:hypothetical protein